ncbi:MAG: hypothetical protein ACJ749_09280, partial [Flavisolibacter sp.]
EVKIIQKGDSLTGTSYYYESSNNYRRYSIKGYFDPNTNSVVWWDDQLLENKGGNAGKNPQLSVADFNCPGGGEMYLDGKSAPKQDREDPKASVHLTKVPGASFPDEWDFVIDNYTVGANDPEIIDSVQLISYGPVKEAEVIPERKQEVSQPAIVKKPEEKIEAKIEPVTIEEKFKNREKIFTKEIPISGDSIELRFYDNAEIDGDSISLFLNDKLLFSHVRLTDKAYRVKLSVKEMNETNELTMVAENLGSIPPNTSYMIAIVGDKRYDARLASTENSSAMIRLRKPTSF